MQAARTLEQFVSGPQPKIRMMPADRLGVHRFYFLSQSQPGTEYVVQHVRAYGQHRWFCNCPDFTYRRLPRKRLCKHARFLSHLVRLARGFRRLRKMAGAR